MSGSCEWATVAVETMKVITGDDDIDGACDAYVPGAWDTVWSESVRTFIQVRRCRDCRCVEEDHDEPAESTRQTIVPGEPAGVEAPISPRLDEELARDTIRMAMGGGPDTYLARVGQQVAGMLGRELNRWEELALRAYVATVAIEALLEVAQ